MRLEVPMKLMYYLKIRFMIGMNVQLDINNQTGNIAA